MPPCGHTWEPATVAGSLTQPQGGSQTDYEDVNNNAPAFAVPGRCLWGDHRCNGGTPAAVKPRGL